jgi:REP element-mobilizing transposase RayT
MVTRSKRRAPQLELPKFDKNGQRRGGRRPGAGRKPNGPGGGASHLRRPDVRKTQPQHVTLRCVKDVGYLRKPHAYRAIRRALVAVAAHTGFRVVHLSLQGTHVHLLCEANDRVALSRGVQGFQISAAKALHRELAKRGGPQRGRVFADRYHAVAISSVRQVRHALAYVLNNWRRHREDRDGAGLANGRIDPFSSGLAFPGWREPVVVHGLGAYEPLPVLRPESWLLAEGWKRAPAISVYEVPGPS